MENLVTTPDGSLVPVLYKWDADIQSYIGLNSLETGSGHWMAALDDTLLSINSTQTSSQSVVQTAKDKTVLSWEGTITASLGSGRIQNLTFGLSPDATEGFDMGLDIPLPPATQPPISLDFAFSVSHPLFPRLRRDIREYGKLAQWSLNLRADNEDIKLTWDMSNIPDEDSVILKVDDKIVDMKKRDFLALSRGVYSITLEMATTGKFYRYPLKPGWNLFSFNSNKCFYEGQKPADQPACVELVDVKELGFDNLADWFTSLIKPNRPSDITWQQVTGDNGIMDRFLPANANSLHYMSPCFGYWVRIDEATGGAYLSIRESPFIYECGIPLHKGWNLVGYPMMEGYYDTDEVPNVPVPLGTKWNKVGTSAVSYVFGSIMGKCDYIMGPDGFYNPHLPKNANSLHYIAPGYGYWIKMRDEDELLYP